MESSAFPTLDRAIGRTFRRALATSLVMATAGGLMLILPFATATSRGASIGLTLFGALLTVVAAGLFWSMAWRNRSPAHSPVMRLLLEHPGEVVWVYVDQLESQAVGATVNRSVTVYLWRRDGKASTLATAEHEALALLAQLDALLPEATFGYDAELESRYRRDPNSLSRAQH